MADYSIYQDIAERTGGDIYIGVVGPVRTGKSTFIKRFMEALVIPNISNEYSRDRARDEMPQSAAGKTVMTTEPKFIPDEAVSISIDDCANLKVRMIDCVGYIVPDALGTIENGQPRLVRTPWQEAPLPFAEAAEKGTYKVITEHSTIGMIITTDGTIGDIARSSYVEAEERVVRELRAIGKPFALVLNSANPSSDDAIALAYELEAKYNAPVALVSCLELDAEDIRHILELVLHEFPITEISINLPLWLRAIGDSHKIKTSILGSIRECAAKATTTGVLKQAFEGLEDNQYVKSCIFDNIDLGNGRAEISIELTDDLFYEVMSELTGFEVRDEQQLIILLQKLSAINKEYEKVSDAINNVNESGYGIVMPTVEDLHLEEPEIVKQNGSYGVRLRASAQSIHMIRANIETEISPIVGTEQQSEELIRYMLKDYIRSLSICQRSHVSGLLKLSRK